MALSRLMRVARLLVCAATVLCVAGAHAAVTVTTDPTSPLLDVAFCATLSPSSVGSRALFVAAASDCSTPLANATRECGTSGWYAFNVTSEKLKIVLFRPVLAVPDLYWCAKNADGSTTQVGSLHMSVVRTSPMYFYKGESNTLTFNEATPVGSTIRLFGLPSCEFPLSEELSVGSPGSSVTATLNTRFPYVYICAAVPSTASSGFVPMTLRNTIISAVRYSITPVVGVRHDTVTVDTQVDTIVYYAFSSSSTCSDLPVPDVSNGNSAGKVKVTVNKLGGEYYFCGADTSKVYVPAENKFTVREYGVQPHTTYAGMPTAVSLTMAAAEVPAKEVALFTTPGCEGTPVQRWSSSGQLLWTVASAGTYYACVRELRPSSSPAKAYYANAYVVASMPTLRATPAVAVLGFPLTVALSGETMEGAVYTVGLATAGNGCSAMAAFADVTGGSAAAPVTFAVAAGPQETTLYFCVSNPVTYNASDSSEATRVAYYSLGQVSGRLFRLGYDALRAGSITTVALDDEQRLAHNTAVSFVAVASASAETVQQACGGATGHTSATEVACTVTASNTLAGVTFPSAGKWAACAASGVGSQAYAVLRVVEVYSAAATLSVGVLLVGAQVALHVTAIPDAAAVTLVSGATCGSSAPVATSRWSGKEGYAELDVTASAVGLLLVCVAYPSASASAAASTTATFAVLSAGTVRTARAAAYPSIVYVNESSVLRFAVADNATLEGYVAKLIADGAGCGTAGSTPSPAMPVSGPGGDAQGRSHVVLSQASLTAGTVYAVCVGMSGGNAYASAGVVAAVSTPTLATDTEPSGVVAFGLPVHVTLPLTFVQATGADVFTVVDGATDCTADLQDSKKYGDGSIDVASGTATAFVAPAASTPGVTALRVCVAARATRVSDTLGYASAGLLAVTRFHTTTAAVQVERVNVVGGAPVSTLDGTQLLLGGCSGRDCNADAADHTCANARLLYTSATVAFAGSAGTYLVCQRVTLGTTTYLVGSDTTVSAVEPYVLVANVTAPRAYVPFTVTLTGGAADAVGGAREVVVQPASVSCGSAVAEAQRFTLSGGGGRVTITHVTPGQDIVFCLIDASLGSVPVLTAHLLHYMTPAAVIAGVATTLTSAAAPVSGAYAKLASTAACTDEVTGGEAVALVNSQAAFKVNGCSSTTRTLGSVYYCETSGGGVYESRGAVGILRPSNCSEGQRESIEMVYAAPGAAISSYGLASSLLTEPRLSWTGDCTSLVDSRVGTVGYAPGVNETATFFVCARVVGAAASLTFTTEKPTLRVLNWAASPSAALSRYNLTMGTQPSVRVQLNYPAPSPDTFFSAAKGCTASLASAAALATPGAAATYRTVGVSGLVYVCTTNPLTAAPVAVARFLSVTPPAVVKATPAVVRGAAYTVQLAVEGSSPLYSMQPGVDATFAYHEYYTSNNRSVFLSTDECGSALGGVVAAVDTQGRVTFTTNAISTALEQLALCAGTPAGVGTVLARVTVTAGNVYPTVLVSGVRGAPIFIPLYPRTAFALSASSSDCSATSGMPTFTTDGEGYGAASLVDGSGSALASGQYMLCYDAAVAGASGGGGRGDGSSAPAAARAAMTALDVVELRAASHFAVRGTTFVVGVAGTAELLQDLVSSYLVPGLSTTRNCTTMTTEYGTWSAKSDTAVVVNATATAGSGLYLCAVAPLNNSLVALPGATGVRFATSSIVLPSGEWDACHEYAIAQCVPPGSSAAPTSADVLAVVHGECCSSARVVVGQSSMSSGTCRLRMDYKAMQSYGSNATFSVCVLNRDDDAVCTTLATGVAVTTSCTPAAAAGNGLGGGVVAGIVVGCVVGGLLLIALVIFLVWLCRRRRHGRHDGVDKVVSGAAALDEDAKAVAAGSLSCCFPTGLGRCPFSLLARHGSALKSPADASGPSDAVLRCDAETSTTMGFIHAHPGGVPVSRIESVHSSSLDCLSTEAVASPQSFTSSESAQYYVPGAPSSARFCFSKKEVKKEAEEALSFYGVIGEWYAASVPPGLQTFYDHLGQQSVASFPAAVPGRVRDQDDVTKESERSDDRQHAEPLVIDRAPDHGNEQRRLSSAVSAGPQDHLVAGARRQSPAPAEEVAQHDGQGAGFGVPIPVTSGIRFRPRSGSAVRSSGELAGATGERGGLRLTAFPSRPAANVAGTQSFTTEPDALDEAAHNGEAHLASQRPPNEPPATGDGGCSRATEPAAARSATENMTALPGVRRAEAAAVPRRGLQAPRRASTPDEEDDWPVHQSLVEVVPTEQQLITSESNGVTVTMAFPFLLVEAFNRQKLEELAYNWLLCKYPYALAIQMTKSGSDDPDFKRRVFAQRVRQHYVQCIARAPHGFFDVSRLLRGQLSDYWTPPNVFGEPDERAVPERNPNSDDVRTTPTSLNAATDPVKEENDRHLARVARIFQATTGNADENGGFECKLSISSTEDRSSEFQDAARARGDVPAPPERYTSASTFDGPFVQWDHVPLAVDRPRNRQLAESGDPAGDAEGRQPADSKSNNNSNGSPALQKGNSVVLHLGAPYYGSHITNLILSLFTCPCYHLNEAGKPALRCLIDVAGMHRITESSHIPQRYHFCLFRENPFDPSRRLTIYARYLRSYLRQLHLLLPYKLPFFFRADPTPTESLFRLALWVRLNDFLFFPKRYDIVTVIRFAARVRLLVARQITAAQLRVMERRFAPEWIRDNEGSEADDASVESNTLWLERQIDSSFSASGPIPAAQQPARRRQ